MAYKSYIEKLRDPRWQRKRLEIMQRANFACEACESTEKTLNVHHKLYRKGADPWDYADHELACLCEDCHATETDVRKELDEALAVLDSSDFQRVAGFAQGLALLRRMDDSPETTLIVPSIENAVGVALSVRAEYADAQALLDKWCERTTEGTYRLTAFSLYSLLRECVRSYRRLQPESDI